MMAAMKIAFLLAVAVLAFLMVTDARRLLDYDDCHRGACLYPGRATAERSIDAEAPGGPRCAILGHKRPFLQVCPRSVDSEQQFKHQRFISVARRREDLVDIIY